MGLDMYLKRKKFIGAQYEHRNVTGKIEIKAGEKEIPIDFKKVSYIEEDVCYWRKANAIHKWFVDNVQGGVDNCGEYYVSSDDLKELLFKCEKVKEKAILTDGKIQNGSTFKDGKWEPIIEDGKFIENVEDIEEILPTQSGCFFGSTDYDEYYMEDIEYTIEKLREILQEEEEYNDNGIYSDFYYTSSW